MLLSPLAERTALSSNLPATPTAGSGLLLLSATVEALHCGWRSRLLQDAALLFRCRDRPGHSRTIAAGEACGLRRCARPDPPRPGVCRRCVHCSRRGAQGRARLVGSRAAEARRTASMVAAPDGRPCGRTAGRVGVGGWGARGRRTGWAFPWTLF
jgi:hypothetical protein